MQLSKAEVDDSKRISIIYLVASNIDDQEFEIDAENDQYMEDIKYNSISSIIRQCDKSKAHDPRPYLNNTFDLGNASTNGQQLPRIAVPRRTQNKTRLSQDQLADLKSRSQCHKCKKFGHWSTDHN